MFQSGSGCTRGSALCVEVDVAWMPQGQQPGCALPVACRRKQVACHMAWCLTVINLTVMDVRAGVLASVKVNPALWQGPAGEGLDRRRG